MINWFKNLISENLMQLLQWIFPSALLTALTVILNKLINIYSDYLQQNPKTALFIIFTMSILLSITISLLFYIWIKSRKKLIGRILVDKKGECYCLYCRRYLEITKDTVITNYPIFYCKKCDVHHRPFTENGLSSAIEFYKQMKNKPPKFLF